MGADKSLAWPGRKQDNVSVRMSWISLGALPCKKKKLDDSSSLDVVEIARVPNVLPSFFRSCSGLSAPGSVIQPRTTRAAQSLAPTVEKRNEHSNIPSCHIKRGKIYDDLRNSLHHKKYFATRG